MKTLAELRAQLGELDSKRKAFEAAHKDKAMTAEERTEFRGLLDEIDGVLGDIELAERSEKVGVSAAAPQQPRIGLEIHDVADEAPYTFGEFLRDVAAAGMGHDRTNRLLAHQKRNLEALRREIRSSTGLNEALPADGGFLVGETYGGQIMARVYENSQVAGRCARMPISGSSNSMKLNGIDESSRANGSRWGGVRAYWIEEGGALTGSRPKFRQVELNLKKLAALVYPTDELIQDAAALESFVMRVAPGEIAFMLQDAIVNGSGAGKPLGFLQAPCLVTVTKETGQEADSIVFQNISKIWSRLWAPSRLNSIWLINQEIEPQLDMLSIPVGTGGIPVYMPPGGASEAPFGRIKGRPVIPIEQAAGLGDAGDISLVDLSQFQLIDKGGVQTASSMHVAFTTDEMVYRFIFRVDGMPLWHTALTPFKGTANTLSPFVTLGARA
ncbi:MAG TPA: phage major capsid protein [Polyangia bacterium]|nr:phage major capsid protein [Polyangia bacterium]